MTVDIELGVVPAGRNVFAGRVRDVPGSRELVSAHRPVTQVAGETS